jgi:parallel beta-helix repeat protein
MVSAFTAPVRPIPTPTGVETVALSPTVMSVWWNPSSGATRYQVKRDGVVIARLSATTWLDATASPGTSYSYRVKACAGGRCSEFSSPVSGTTPASCRGVVVASGADIQAAVNAHGSGTTFCVQGTHNLSSTITPKDGDSFIGDPTATVDGGSTIQFAFSGNQNGINNVTVMNLVVQHFVPPTELAALDHSPGTGWVIQGNDVSFNSTEGIEVFSGGLVQNNHVHDNGQLGIFGYKPVGAVVQNNEIDHNNTAYYDQSWEAGGIKICGSSSVVITGNYVHDNWGTGIWLDTNDTGYLIDHNTVINNSHSGIKVEAALSGTVSNNTVTDSGFLQPSPYGGDGINVDRSSTVVVGGNTVTCSQHSNFAYVNGSLVTDTGNTSSGC